MALSHYDSIINIVLIIIIFNPRSTGIGPIPEEFKN